MKENIFFKGKLLGTVDTEREVYVSRRTKEHQFHIFGDGFGLSEKVIRRLYDLDVQKILINFEDRHLFWVKLDIFVCKGKDWNDNGDKQIILPLKFWNEDEIKFEQQMLVVE